MGYQKTIVCLANSRKTGGTCVAGKEWHNGQFGPWVRPVSHRPSQELSFMEQCCQHHDRPLPLDIVTIPCLDAEPLPHQPENHRIDHRRRWQLQAKMAWSQLREGLDQPESLWGVGESSRGKSHDRLAVQQAPLAASLYLIATERISLAVAPRSGRPDAKRVMVGRFEYRGHPYALDITDPVMEGLYLSRPDGLYTIANPVLCISLGHTWEGYHYKLIAAVLCQERFA
ncbi:MAG: hypothetical protein HQL88_09660 [Magnetococcales bacterium]|nr:hypothetical protein [Magnetococcales bacterium]